MQTNDDTERIRQALHLELPLLARSYNVESLALFGSYVRQENRSDSDLDVLVSYAQTPSLFQFVELENHLGDLLGVKVDLVMRDSLKLDVRKIILEEAVPV